MDTEKQHKAHTASAVSWAGIAVVAIILLALLVLPGFMAAWFSRTGGFTLVFVNDSGWSHLYDAPSPGSTFAITVAQPTRPLRVRAEKAALAPSAWVMKHSRALSRFYIWQFRLAGGRTLLDVEVAGLTGTAEVGPYRSQHKTP
ncbi:MAG TPA: hypothetical protein VG733_04035 [Chthoniobacteraceae bacterium]|nr:hypothetical protein [Chthoniobacteraceae bacterium]